ncbi:MAG: ribonuclease HII [Thermomicrobiaceae bacterium]
MSFEFEQRLWQSGLTRVAGVDEAGRGCLAGPVVAASCVLPPECDPLEGVRDSKLTRRDERAELVRLIRDRAIAIGIGAASCREIDRINIRAASVLAMKRALRRMGEWEHALIDGPLPPEFVGESADGIVDGDALCPSIACASILAKTCRDDLMAKLSYRHPDFGWDRNMGYGTPVHRDALIRHGPTPHHRRSFRPVSQLSLPLGDSGETD